jgi:pyridoxal phosphate enzyme (YggS family)
VTHKERLDQIRDQIRTAALRSGRNEDEITLVAVSKTFPLSDIISFAHLGQVDFGENKLQEFVQKADELARTHPEMPVRWHCIGHLQRNKAKDLIGRTHLFHALDSLRLAQTLQQRLTDRQSELNCLVQVNVSGEASKFGLEPHQLDAFMDNVLMHDRLNILGLMTLAAPAEDPESVRPQFAMLRKLAESVQDRLKTGAKPVLSMGMSSDFEVAIEEGATLVRVGSSLFGGRTYETA